MTIRRPLCPTGAEYSEAGFTLVEMLVTVAIVGIAFAVFVGGMLTSIIGSDSHRKAANVDLAARTFADAIESLGTSYFDCTNTNAATVAHYQAAYAPPSGITAAVNSVEYLDSAVDTGGAGVDPFVASPCHDGVQRVTITVHSLDNRATQVLKIMKRQP